MTSSSSSYPASTPWKTTDLEAWRATMQATHDSGVNMSFEWRRDQIQAMRRLVQENQDDLAAALKSDLGKDETEGILCEMEQVLGDVKYFETHLRRLMEPTAVASPAVLLPSRTWVEPRPLLGPAVLIIGPCNYPISLCLQPALGSLAAGNPTMMKPSEQCPATCEILARLVPQYFDPSACRVVLGQVEETKLLLKQPWGKVLFTGSPAVGRLVAQQTAQTLTPTVLELGGKCPCYIDGEGQMDWKLAANRVVFAKLLNCGQTCAAVDYLIVPRERVDQMLPCLVKAVETQFGADPKLGELGRICTQQHAQRQVQLLTQVEEIIQDQQKNHEKDTEKECRIVLGGSAECNAAERYIRPTIVLNPPLDSRLMQEEVFGPILSVLTVDSRAEAMELMKHVESVAGTPLCLYVFAQSSKVCRDVTLHCRAGSVMCNDCLIHLSNSQIPFGGLGQSGYGVYHGPHSFDTFSQKLPITQRPMWSGSDFGGMRNHPYGTGLKQTLLRKVVVQLPLVPPIPKAVQWSVGTLALGLVALRLLPGPSALVWRPVLETVVQGLESVVEYLKAVATPPDEE